MNEIKITVPESMEIERIKFKPIKKKLPKTWEELKYIEGYYIDDDSNIKEIYSYPRGTYPENRNIFPTKELVEASLALTQLLQLREVYNDGWQPDYTNNNQPKYVIYYNNDKIDIGIMYEVHCILSFKTSQLRDEFLNNFRTLIDIAKPLL